MQVEIITTLFLIISISRKVMKYAQPQAVSSTRKAHSVSIGEVSSRTHIEGESQDHFEASSRNLKIPTAVMQSLLCFTGLIKTTHQI
jgi:hypothetical protein